MYTHMHAHAAVVSNLFFTNSPDKQSYFPWKTKKNKNTDSCREEAKAFWHLRAVQSLWWFFLDLSFTNQLICGLLFCAQTDKRVLVLFSNKRTRASFQSRELVRWKSTHQYDTFYCTGYLNEMYMIVSGHNDWGVAESSLPGQIKSLLRWEGTARNRETKLNRKAGHCRVKWWVFITQSSVFQKQQWWKDEIK